MLDTDFGTSAIEVEADGEVLLRTTAAGKRRIEIPVAKKEAFLLSLTCVKGGFSLDSIGWEKPDGK